MNLGKGSGLAGDVLSGPGQPLLEGDVAGGGDHVEQLGSGEKKVVMYFAMR